MNSRELGSMRIVNLSIGIYEVQPTKEELEEFALLEGMGLPTRADHLTWWFAVEGQWAMGKPWLAYGTLITTYKETVDASVFVAPEHRGKGLGHFMWTFATDLAIRHRQRIITVDGHPSSEAQTRILECEDFEVDTTTGVRWKKELRWQ